MVEAIRAAVSRRHALPIADVQMVAAGAIPRTTSGSWPGGRAAPSIWRGSPATVTPPTDSPGAATDNVAAVSEYQTLTFEQAGPIARIVLNRPDAANGMNDVMTA